MKTKRALLSAVFLLAPLFIFAQGIYFGPKSTYNEHDSVIIALKGYTGQLQWQKSYDGILWFNLPGETQDSLLFIADSTTLFRASVTAGWCGPYISDTACITVTRMNKKAEIIDSSSPRLVSGEQDLLQGRYVFETSDTSLYHPGDVLVSSADSGYIRKVKQVMLQNDSLILETEQGTLEDVFCEIELGDSVLLTIDSRKQGYINGVPVPMRVVYMIEGAHLKSKGSGINLDNVVLFSGSIEAQDSSGATVSAELTAKIANGSISFEPVFHRKLAIEWFRLKEFQLSAGGTINLDLDLELDCDASFNYSNEITLARYAYGPVMIGFVPMFIELSFTAGFEAGASLSGVFGKGFDAASSIELGAAYYRGRGWSGIWSKSGSFNNHPMNWDLDGNVTAKAYVKPQISVLIARVAGPYMEVVPYLRFDGNVDFLERTWDWEFAGGLDANLGFKAAILGYSLGDYNTTLANWEKIILSGEGTFAKELPVLSTTSISGIGETFAGSGGNISSDGGASVTARGVCWNTSGSPGIEDYTTIDGTGVGAYSSYLSGLNPGTTYYVRAYATNSVGTAYGNEVHFTTVPHINPPSLITDSITGIKGNLATCRGTVSVDGGSPVLGRGFCWNTTGSPTLRDFSKAVGSGSGSFTALIGGMNPTTMYYLRAYGYNAVDTGYGNELVFTTTADVVDPPALTTDSVGYLTEQTAVVWSVISSAGGSPVDYRGVCWNKTGTPVITDSIRIRGAGTGSYFVQLTGLVRGTTYHVRAFAVNASDTAYGNELVFTADSSHISCPSTITDIDGKTYHVVKIGCQCWMKENLNVTHYADGSSLQLVSDTVQWSSLGTESKAWCYQENNALNRTNYGALYTWSAASNLPSHDGTGELPGHVQGVCPTGWHLPGEPEYEILLNYLGGTSIAGMLLKEPGTNHWHGPNQQSNNLSGFTALGGGQRESSGNYMDFRYSAHFWTSSSYRSLFLFYQNTNALVQPALYKEGKSVRCVKD
ncbi:MAG: fibrobacter succinogenes major paralogous domain-containing protein [Bacteroidales bacterium]